MIFNRTIYAIGGMAFAYILSVISLNVSKSLAESRKPKFLVNIFIFIYYFSSIFSLFVGLFMHYQIENQADICKREFDKEREDLQQQISSLSIEIADLRLNHSSEIH